MQRALKLEQAKNQQLSSRLEKSDAKLKRFKEEIKHLKTRAKSYLSQLKVTQICSIAQETNHRESIGKLKKRYAKCESLLMATMQVKLSYEKVIQDAMSDQALKHKLLFLI